MNKYVVVGLILAVGSFFVYIILKKQDGSGVSLLSNLDKTKYEAQQVGQVGQFVAGLASLFSGGASGAVAAAAANKG